MIVWACRLWRALTIPKRRFPAGQVLEKCEVSLLLSGKCTAKADWAKLSNELGAASTAAAKAVGRAGGAEV
jgi:hypothetical protein